MAERKTKQRFRVKARGTTNTYVYCRIASRNALEHAEAVPDGALYFCMMAGVFACFTVEAFLNHLGQANVQDWDALERKLGPREKFLLLRKVLKLSADESHRPFQTLRTMLRLRDALAHGKTETVVSDLIIKQKPRAVDLLPEPEWKKLCTIANAKRMVEDAEAIVRELNTQTGSSDNPFLSLGSGRSGTSEVGGE